MHFPLKEKDCHRLRASAGWEWMKSPQGTAEESPMGE